MSAFAITFGAGSVRRFLALADPAVLPAKGWTPYRWTADLERAELFSTAAKAHAFAAEELKHDRYGVQAVPPRRRLPPSGGTPQILRSVAA